VPFNLQTLIEPAAQSLAALTTALQKYDQPVIFVGEGLHSYADTLTEILAKQAVVTSAPYRLCKAALVAIRGQSLLRENPDRPYEELLPVYLRKPEAERLAAERRGGSE